MGRRHDHSPEALKALALSAAQEILKRHGLSGLTVRRIAEEIGYSPGTLYNHFDNLDDLLLQVNAQTLGKLLRRLVEVSRQEGAPEAVLRAMARAYIEESRAEPALWAAIFEHRMARDGLPSWYAAYLVRLFEPLEQALLPILPDSHRARHRTARILWSAVHGITLLAARGSLDVVASIPAEEMADELVATFLAGLKSD